jgi:hypothetical protein
VGEAKVEIACSQGKAEGCQELYRVAERADGLAVREDDAEPEPLEDESMELEDGDVVAMAMKVGEISAATLSTLRNLTLLRLLLVSQLPGATVVVADLS